MLHVFLTGPGGRGTWTIGNSIGVCKNITRCKKHAQQIVTAYSQATVLRTSRKNIRPRNPMKK